MAAHSGTRRAVLVLSTFSILCLFTLPHTLADRPQTVVFHDTDEGPVNSTVSKSYASPFFERKYSTGWFTTPIILNARVETSQLVNLLTQRKRTHYPSYITAHCVEYPTPLVLFNILWLPNSANWRWTLVLNMEGRDFQTKLDDLMNLGQKPNQVDSYAFRSHGTIYYSAIFLAQEKWDPETDFDVAFGYPKDGSYCCGPSSRWVTLQAKGFKPLSLSVTQDPASGFLYVADVWNTRDVAFWQANCDQYPGALQSLLAALAPPLVPFFVKSYRVVNTDGTTQILYSYIAEGNASIPKFAATIDISRSGIELLANVLSRPPLFVSSFFSEGELDPQDPTSGDMYAAVWQQTASAALIQRNSSSLRKKMVEYKSSVAAL